MTKYDVASIDKYYCRCCHHLRSCHREVGDSMKCTVQWWRPVGGSSGQTVPEQCNCDATVADWTLEKFE